MFIFLGMKKPLAILFLLCFLWHCSTSENNNPPLSVAPVFYKGMDLSFQPELEDYNIEYKDASGNLIDLLDFVNENGTNLLRLKLWHTPKDGQNSLADVKAYAKRIKAQNMAFLLNFHYSDYWADPGKQNPPEAWKNMSQQELRMAIFNYTKDVLEALKNQNTLPDMVQIGNETDSGFLWNYGKVWNEFDNNWGNYVALLKEAIRAVKMIDSNEDIKIMLHHSSVENAVYFFDRLAPYKIDFDVIGLSYYPQFQIKDLDLVQLKLD